MYAVMANVDNFIYMVEKKYIKMLLSHPARELCYVSILSLK